MPKRKYTAAEREEMGLGSSKRKGSGTTRTEREFSFRPPYDEEPDYISETRGRPSNEWENEDQQADTNSGLQWAGAAAVAAFTMLILFH